MPECPTTNIPQRVCDLETAVAELLANTGHPPAELTNLDAPFSWDIPTQQGNIPQINYPAIPEPEVVLAADDTARGLLAPTKLDQLLVQHADATNGNFSIWKATALVAGAWSLRVAGMALQNPSTVAITGGTITGITDLAVADGGTGASTAANARVNLTIPSDGPIGVNFDWSLRSHFWELIAANTVFTFSNVIDGASVMVSVHSVGAAYTVGWPASVRWSGGTPPVHSGADKIDVYAFTVMNAIIYGSVVANFPDT